MRVTKEKASENRELLLRTASRLFRERGFDGVGVGEICKEAGLTHGALYARFPSKDALAAEALSDGIAKQLEFMKDMKDGEAGIAEYLNFYFSKSHRDDVGTGCSLGATASEIGRQDVAVSASFASGFENFVRTVESSLQRVPIESRHSLAITFAVAMIGGISVSRGVARADPTLSNEILNTVQKSLLEISS